MDAGKASARIAVYVLLLISSVSRQASAAASDAAPSLTAPAPMAVPPFSAASLIQLLLGLGLVIALIFALAWFVRRTGALGSGQNGMRVVATLPLSTRERAVLVQVGEQQLLLGVAPGRVNLLQRFETPVVDPQASAGSDFAGRLKDAMSRSKES